MSTTAYPVKEMAGLLFIYMGPGDTITGLPHWDMLTRLDGRFRIELQAPLACNWLQCQENSADVTHTFFLHSRHFERLGIEDPSGYALPMRKYGFQPFDWGIVKSWVYEDPQNGNQYEGWGSPLVFPNMLHIETEIHWRIPIDDESTRIIIVGFDPDGEPDGTIDVVTQPPRTGPDGTYLLDTFFSQDGMAWETQGKVHDRTSEQLGASDSGVIMFRRMLSEQIDLVEQGSTPLATVPIALEPAVINIRGWMGGYLPMSAPPDPTIEQRRSREEIFDDRHRTFRVAGSLA